MIKAIFFKVLCNKKILIFVCDKQICKSIISVIRNANKVDVVEFMSL